MVEDTSPSQDAVEISGNVVHKIDSYDKDVVEIKLADTLDTDKYGGNFVKDVCIDEGTLLHPKFLEEKPIDRRLRVSCPMTQANSDMIYWKKDDARKSANELKPETIVQVDLTPSCKNDQYSSGKKYDDHYGMISTDYIAGDLSDKKISLQELLLLESAEESRLASTRNCEGSEKQHPHEGTAGQASISDSHETRPMMCKTSDHVSSGVSSTMSEDQGASSDMKKINQIDRHNPFIDHRSLVPQDTLQPACYIPAITDDASTEPICTVSKTDSFRNVSGTTGLIEVKTAESKLDAASSSNEIQLSEKSNNNDDNLASSEITEAGDEAAVSTSSARNNADNQEKSGVDGVSEIHNFNQIDEENCIAKDNAASKTVDSAVVQTVPESSRSTAHTGSGDPYESNLFGPSIMPGSMSNSGHIAYSGNVSIRSESSTTSTRSFAFPVLQREWISSPVRMAKAERNDRRHLRWRKGLICCKF